MTIAFIIITLVYVILIGSLIIGNARIKTFNGPSIHPETPFTIIIPLRNESEHLPDLLKSISQLDYPDNLYEIIFIDDASDDNSVEIINALKIDFELNNTIVLSNDRLTNSPKKDAIVTGINHSNYDWIVTTDADCILPRSWLLTLNNFIQDQQPKMIVAPVTYMNPNSLLDGFQLMDFMSLQAATIGGFGINKPFLCNGANFAYTKQLFYELDGFDGNSNIASGDDIFLLEKAISRERAFVKYLKSHAAIITTHPQPDFSELIQQRLRWAAKTTSYSNPSGKIIGLTVILMNIIIVVCFFLSLIGLLEWYFIIIVFLFKFIIDFWLIYKSAEFFLQKRTLPYYLISSVSYPFFSVFIAFYALFFNFKWKQRRYSK